VLEKVVPLRERTVQLLNPVISALYDIPTNSPIPSLKEFEHFKIWFLEKINEINKFI